MYKIVSNVFSNGTLEKLAYASRGGRQPNRTNFFCFPEGVVGVSNAIFNFDVDVDLQGVIFEELISKNVLQKTPKDYSIYLNLFSRGSFIPWHCDGDYKFTATVYLNQAWNKDYGGLFLYEVDGENKFLFPEYNLCFCFEPPMMHSTSITSIDAPFRESLQIFVKEWG